MRFSDEAIIAMCDKLRAHGQDIDLTPLAEPCSKALKLFSDTELYHLFATRNILPTVQHMNLVVNPLATGEANDLPLEQKLRLLLTVPELIDGTLDVLERNIEEFREHEAPQPTTLSAIQKHLQETRERGRIMQHKPMEHSAGAVAILKEACIPVAKYVTELTSKRYDMLGELGLRHTCHTLRHHGAETFRQAARTASR